MSLRLELTENDHFVGCSEIQTYTPGLGSDEEDEDIWVILELLDIRVT
jgi:hypothetical protein